MHETRVSSVTTRQQTPAVLRSALTQRPRRKGPGDPAVGKYSLGREYQSGLAWLAV